jgi:hypothetical protein
MQFSVQRFVSMMAVQLILTAAVLFSFCLVTLAQEPTSFEISLTAPADHAVSGQPFTYTLTITNISQQSSKDIIVFMKTPPGTTFAGTQQTANWYVTNPPPGEEGKIGWTTLEPISPSTVVTFELAVNVLEAPDKQLVSEDYRIIPMGGGDVIASGPPLKTQVLSPTPTPISTPSSITVTVETTSSVTAAVLATPVSPTISKVIETPLPSTPEVQADSAKTNKVQPTPTLNVSLKTSTFPTAILLLGLPILIGAIIGLVWILKRR